MLGTVWDARIQSQRPYAQPSLQMTERPRPFRIVGYSGARVPEPSSRLYNALAWQAWNDYKAGMEIQVDHKMPTWDELPDNLRAVWISVAHGQHGVLALHGGGKVKYLDDAE